MTKYRGFHPDNTAFPFKIDQKIVIPAGLTVKSMHPTRGSFVTKRKQWVTLRSFGCGRSFCVGHVYSNGERHGFTSHREDLTTLGKIYGTQDIHELVNHPDTVVRDGNVFLAVENPTVMWAGAGSYWCEVDINLVLEANGVES
jgi:hypothetical protein